MAKKGERLASKPGDLYVVATPIGNLGDMVPRALEVLQGAARVVAEDTRHTRRLLHHFGIHKPLLSLHDHSGPEALERCLELLAAGESLALVCDAGTPLVADPGFPLVREARRRGFRVVPIPGPCAAVAALSAAGLPCERFAFEGFLPARRAARRAALERLRREERTLVFYEAPHRLAATLTDLAEVFGSEREAVLARELTKLHETFLAGTLEELVERVARDPDQQRGEIVLLVAGAPPDSGGDLDCRRLLAALLEALPPASAARVAAKVTGRERRALYRLALEIAGESER
ncbi:MAG: ribosomal RNA small subunit methyltransferase I [Porticoccaceae bacterium]|nr:MAG: ribosomal RNA small subunit methyltransferase I [Porticoccaceae bacterium]